MMIRQPTQDKPFARFVRCVKHLLLWLVSVCLFEFGARWSSNRFDTSLGGLVPVLFLLANVVVLMCALMTVAYLFQGLCETLRRRSASHHSTAQPPQNGDRAKPRSDQRPERLRVICLVCGGEIERDQIPTAPVRSTPARPTTPVFVYREGQLAGNGWAHAACAGTRTVLDLTGKPDYSAYDSDATHPAYPKGYNAVERGKQFDAALRQEREVKETA